MCAIERHPDSSTRDSLTHTLFNLIKRPDEQQRRIIMDVCCAVFFTSSSLTLEYNLNLPASFQACVSLAKNVGEMRTETELLPQCWEQVYLCLTFQLLPLYNLNSFSVCLSCYY
jgi:hypothetical protein